MVRINANTKISALIRANPAAIEAIASINSHFRKLHNPVLRKILASRVTISEAAKIGNVAIGLLYEKLKPLGFVSDDMHVQTMPHIAEADTTRHDEILDVRPDLEMGLDPFSKIMDTMGRLPDNGILLVVNSFEPTPLIRILREQGHDIEVAKAGNEEYHTYITKRRGKERTEKTQQRIPRLSDVTQRYKGKIKEIDVRSLPMPQPMMTILKQLDSINSEHALLVVHKKVPLLLLPELKTRGFDYAYEQTGDTVHLIIYKTGTAVE